MILTSCAPAADDSPDPTSIVPSSTTSTAEPYDELIPSDLYRDPIVPNVGGSPLPTSGGPYPDEIDCEEAEYELCDTGRWACDDIADYCDVGPDSDSGLPDDWDWDK